jgi:uncharacterized RDD family membrane protein YckC
MTARNAGLSRRLGAILYDCLLVFALLMMVATPFIAIREGEAVEPQTDIVYRLILAAVIYAFFVGFWTRTGRTLGMQSWGLQLETPDGNRPSFSAATIRFFAALISWAPLGLGFFWQLWDAEHLTWHDRLSKTRLVYYPKVKK